MEKLILSIDEIGRICNRLAHEIEKKAREKDNGIPVLLCVMNGALPFFHELVKHISIPVILDTIKVASYDGTKSSGEVTVLKEPDVDLKGRDVYVVEDIIDSGLTMHFLKEHILKNYKPKNLYVSLLIKRENPHEVYAEEADFIGLRTSEQRFIVGFGFDYYGLLRNVPYVFVPSVKEMREWDQLLEDDKKRHG